MGPNDNVNQEAALGSSPPVASSGGRPARHSRSVRLGTTKLHRHPSLRPVAYVVFAVIAAFVATDIAVAAPAGTPSRSGSPDRSGNSAFVGEPGLGASVACDDAEAQVGSEDVSESPLNPVSAALIVEAASDACD